MLAELRRFLNDESGIVERIVGIALVVIIAGGILVAVVNAVDPLKDAIYDFLEGLNIGYTRPS